MSMKRPAERTHSARVSLSPSKIPYGGFSPVRLQTGRQARPSSTSSTRLIRASSQGLRSCSPEGHNLPALRPLAVPSRGPWLGNGFCCPTASSLTMASSAPLAPSHRLMHSTMGLCLTAGDERVPTFISVCLSACRLPYPGGPDGCTWLLLPRLYKPSPS